MPGTYRPPAESRDAIDREHETLQAVLTGWELSDLKEQPSPGKWSVEEHLRHLIFAEQVQFGRHLPGIDADMTPNSNDRQRRMDTAAFASLDELLARLRDVHARTLVLTNQDRPEIRKSLDINLRHLRTHIRAVKSLLQRRDQDRS